MPSRVTTSAITVLSVSAALPATNDSTGFLALTFTAVADVVDMGDFGPQYAEVTHNPLATAIVQKFKGSVNYGQMSVKLGRDADDAGQVIIRAALASYLSVSFKILFQDGSIQYFQGKVMSYTTNVGSADQIVGSTVNVGISNAIVEVIA